MNITTKPVRNLLEAVVRLYKELNQSKERLIYCDTGRFGAGFLLRTSAVLSPSVLFIYLFFNSLTHTRQSIQLLYVRLDLLSSHVLGTFCFFTLIWTLFTVFLTYFTTFHNFFTLIWTICTVFSHLFHHFSPFPRCFSTVFHRFSP